MVATHILFDFHLPKIGVSWSKLTSIFFRWVGSSTNRQEIRWTYMMFFRILFFEKRHSYILAIWKDLWCWEHVGWCGDGLMFLFFIHGSAAPDVEKELSFFAQRCRLRFRVFELLKLNSQLRCRNGGETTEFRPSSPNGDVDKNCNLGLTIWKTRQGYHKYYKNRKQWVIDFPVIRLWENSGIIFWMARYGTNFGNLMMISQWSSQWGQWGFGLRW